MQAQQRWYRARVADATGQQQVIGATVQLLGHPACHGARFDLAVLAPELEVVVARHHTNVGAVVGDGSRQRRDVLSVPVRHHDDTQGTRRGRREPAP